MVERFRVFQKGEKKNLARTLITMHFKEFERIDVGEYESLPDLYKDSKGNKLVLHYGEDRLEYLGNFDKEKLMFFQNSYYNTMAKKLGVFELRRDSRLLDAFD